MSITPDSFQVDTAVSIDTDWSTILTLEPQGRQLVNVEVENVGAQAFSDLRVQVKDHPGGEWYTLLSGSDFATVDEINLRDATGANTLAGSSTKAHLNLFINGAWAMRLDAKVASSTTTAKARGNAV